MDQMPGSQKIFTEFPLKDSFKLLDGTYLMFLSKNCVCVQDDEITKLLHCYYKITGGLYPTAGHGLK